MKTLLPLVFAFFTAISFGQVKPVVSQKDTTETIKKEPKVTISNGSFSQNLKSQKISAGTIAANWNDWLALSADHTFVQLSKKKDDLGIEHQNFQQFYKGIPVNSGVVMLHSKDGIATSINGMILPVENFDSKTGISAEAAKNKAMIALNAKTLLTEYPVEMVLLKITTDKKQQTKIAFKVRIDSAEPIQMSNVFIDATTGDVLQKINLIAHADEPGTGQTLYRGQKAITVDSHQGSFRLRESGRKIETYDATNATFTNGTGFENFSDFTNLTPNWSTVNPALDVHWGMEKTYDFYAATFNRNSYDNLGSPIKNFVNGYGAMGRGPNNASALPPPYDVMVFGLGDGIYMNPVVGLDIEGHEFSHMVIEHNGNGGLIYFGESGALNESFADIFGTGVEFYSGENANWTMGENVMVTEPYLRSMSNPNAGTIPSPDCYQGQYWMNTSSGVDSGGVHYNSGVQNFWFYLLSEGGTGTNDFGYNYNVAPIGMAKALQIAYRNLNNYLTPEATYQDARNGSLQATEDLYGIGSPEYASVLEAWSAVNLPAPFCNGTTLLTDATGTFNDNSGNQQYTNFSDCKWVIAPLGAQRITLNFTAFQTELDFDFVTVYDGPTTSAAVLGTYSGSSLPPAISTSMGVGTMCIKFTSDYSFVGQGFTANYTSLIPGTCVELPTFVSTTGTFNDGSEENNYGANQHCKWLIAPPCGETVSLSFTEFETELNKDKILIYDNAAATNLIATVSGTTVPNTVTSTTGIMAVHFVTDQQTQMQGFTANYTSTQNIPTAYTGNSVQQFCDSATIADLSQDAATKWFSAETGGTPLASGLPLMDGAVYFATRSYGCENVPRFPVTANIIPRPVLDSIQPLRKCLRYVLPALAQGKYYTQSGGAGTELAEGTVITTSQTLYIYIASESGLNCGAEMAFEVEIRTDCETLYYGEDFAICAGSNPDPLLPHTTDDSYGEWSPPDINNQETTTYIFTPYQDEYYNPITLIITVNESTTPLFDAIPAICFGENLSELPTTSNNGIAGTWSPALNNQETTTYTFTPNSTDCIIPTSMTIAVNQDIVPTFNAVASICAGGNLVALPTTSINEITGTWSPTLNNQETTTYTFTPNAGQCASGTTMTIEVIPNITPSFDDIAPICAGAEFPELPTTSLNGITGSWSPQPNNMNNTAYTFTPDAGQCATSVIKVIGVNANNPTVFHQVAPICVGGNFSELPTTSVNGIQGTWSPAINNLNTTTYTFTPNTGQCGTVVTMTIEVVPIVTPEFNQILSICAGGELSALPVNSLNSITGTWSPALNNLETTTYTFTPSENQCAVPTTMTITVNEPTVPQFDAVAAICKGSFLNSLPFNSTNGITGNWSPAMNNQQTTTYTFTPSPGQCATTATMTVTINEPVIPTFDHAPAVCSSNANSILDGLPTTSNNGISGSWTFANITNTSHTFNFTPTAGQCATNASMTVTVIPQPIVGSGGLFACDGYILPELLTGHYFTEPGGNGTMLEPGHIITQTQTVYIYAETETTPNCTAEGALQIFILSVPRTVEVEGSTITAFAGADSYVWMNCETGEVVPGANDNTFTATENGSYSVSISFESCIATSDCIEIDSLGVDDLKNNTLSIYPNPATTTLFLKNSNGNTIDHVILYDMTGRKVGEKKGIIDQIDTSYLAAGTYLLQAFSDERQYQERFIKH